MSEKRTIQLTPLLPDQKEYLDGILKRSKPPTEKELKNFLIPGPNFDPELSPQNFQNRAAARLRNWKFDPQKRMYRDKDGALVADIFGQLL